MPMNSEAMIPAFATRSVRRTRAVARSEKVSRIRSENPLPVTAPIRALISWTTPTQIVTSTMAQSRP
jgi:hypothetical protein